MKPTNNQTIPSMNTNIPRLFLFTLLLGLSGSFALPAAAQQLDSPSSIQSFPAGNSPEGLAFDGASIWVANEIDNTVTKLRPSDGAIEGVFPVGARPKYLVFDGVNIWVANVDDRTVTKLRASDGTLQGTFPAGPSLFALTFDG